VYVWQSFALLAVAATRVSNTPLYINAEGCEGQAFVVMDPVKIPVEVE
jgi:hypothetical protein